MPCFRMVNFLSPRSHHKLRGRFRNLKATIILLHAGCACMHSTYEYGCLVDHIVCKGGEEAADTNKPPMFLPSAVSTGWSQKFLS